MLSRRRAFIKRVHKGGGRGKSCGNWRLAKVKSPVRTKSPKASKAAIKDSRKAAIIQQRRKTSVKTVALAMRGLQSFIDHELVAPLPPTFVVSALAHDVSDPIPAIQIYPKVGEIQTLMKKSKRSRSIVAKIRKKNEAKSRRRVPIKHDHMAHGRKVHKTLERAALRLSGQIPTHRKMRLDPQSTAILHVLKQQQLIPIAPESRVSWNAAQLRTHAELICEDRTTTAALATEQKHLQTANATPALCNVEFKTRVDNYQKYTMPAFQLARSLLPADAKPKIISCMDKDLLQSLCETILCKMANPNKQFTQAYLAHTPAKGVAKLYACPEWIHALTKPIARCMLATASHRYRNPFKPNQLVPIGGFTPPSQLAINQPAGLYA